MLLDVGIFTVMMCTQYNSDEIVIREIKIISDVLKVHFQGHS